MTPRPSRNNTKPLKSGCCQTPLGCPHIKRCARHRSNANPEFIGPLLRFVPQTKTTCSYFAEIR